MILVNFTHPTPTHNFLLHEPLLPRRLSFWQKVKNIFKPVVFTACCVISHNHRPRPGDYVLFQEYGMNYTALVIDVKQYDVIGDGRVRKYELTLKAPKETLTRGEELFI